MGYVAEAAEFPYGKQQADPGRTQAVHSGLAMGNEKESKRGKGQEVRHGIRIAFTSTTQKIFIPQISSLGSQVFAEAGLCSETLPSRDYSKPLRCRNCSCIQSYFGSFLGFPSEFATVHCNSKRAVHSMYP